LWRFADLLGRTDTAQSPTERMLRDPLFLANLSVWVLLTLACIHGLLG
jgi:hypothetical protein